MPEQAIVPERSVIEGLLIGCPMGRELDDCPMRERRVMSPENRRIEVGMLSPDELEDVIVHHTQCMKKRRS